MTEDVYGRPCRACSDFKQWMKTGPTTSDNNNNSGASADTGHVKTPVSTVSPGAPPDHHTCPPDRQELGNKSWTLLHSIAAYFPKKPTQQQQDDATKFMTLFSRLYPCQVLPIPLLLSLTEK